MAKKAQPKSKPSEDNLDAQQKEIELLKNQLEETKSNWLRARADYENLVKRIDRDRQEWVSFANAELLREVLEVSDNLERAANYINDTGLDMVRNSMRKLLANFGVEEIDAKGKEFDPQIMEGVDQAEGEENRVVKVQQKGYTLHGRVLRPAKVVVGKKTTH